MNEQKFSLVLDGAMLDTDEIKPLYEDFMKMGDYISRVAQTVSDDEGETAVSVIPPMNVAELREDRVSELPDAGTEKDALKQARRYSEPYVEIPRIV
jgi:Asp-tRNA(Asn)/Glu-tRNA(Gln) amidotransferase C subunit